MLRLNTMKAGFAGALIATRDANVKAIVTGAAYAIMACHPGFPRDPEDKVQPLAKVADEIRAMGEVHLAKGKSAKYALAADAVAVARAVLAKFKTGKVDAVDGTVPDLFRVMAEAETADDAAAHLLAAIRSWYGADVTENVSRMMETIKGDAAPAKKREKKEEEKKVDVSTPEGMAAVIADEKHTPVFGLAEARKVLAPAIARLVKARDHDALAALAGDIDAALAQLAATAEPERKTGTNG